MDIFDTMVFINDVLKNIHITIWKNADQKLENIPRMFIMKPDSIVRKSEHLPVCLSRSVFLNLDRDSELPRLCSVLR